MNLSIGEYKLPLGYTAVVEDGKIVVIEKQNYKPNPGDLLYIEYNDWCDVFSDRCSFISGSTRPIRCAVSRTVAGCW